MGIHLTNLLGIDRTSNPTDDSAMLAGDIEDGNPPPSGYWHMVPAHEREQFAAGITQAEATDLLRKDVRIAKRAVVRLI